MSRHGKKYLNTAEKIADAACTMEEAMGIVKANPMAKFDESIDLSLRLGVDPKKTDQTVRGTTSLPHGTGKAVRVAVFAVGAAADSAKEMGADFVGFEDLMEKVKGGWTDFDVAIATPDAMKQVKTLGRTLGPRGLMPNPKTGTVTEDTGAAVTRCKAGRVEFRMDKHGNIHVPVGRMSFEAEKLVENALAAIEAVKGEKPDGIKGAFLKKCSVCSTMGVGVRVEVKD